MKRMGPNAVRLVVVACAAVVTVAGFVAATRPNELEAVAAGQIQIYSTDDGDPIDVFYGLDESGMGCMSVSGGFMSGGSIFYGGTKTTCVDPDELDKGGSYKLLIPASAEMPAVVVGVMPAGATGATVSAIGWKTARAETRGQWFLASLPPADPSPYDLADIRVEFDY